MSYKIEEIVNAKKAILGEMPNIEMPTLGGKKCWDTIKSGGGYRVQVNKFTGLARILDEGDWRVAWGSKDSMVKKFRILTCNDELTAGDIIGVRRAGGIYEHYAVYIGNDDVIHYAAQDEDFGETISIHKAPMKEFLKDSTSFFVLDFPDKYGRPTKLSALGGAFIGISATLHKRIKSMMYHLYSPEETVERAKSRLGETDYNLVFRNCEHFAIWCKTGISESHQVNDILKVINMLPIIRI